MPKKKTKRSRDKYKNLKPELNLKTRYEEIADVASYAKTLSPKDKAWLDHFMKEYTGASLNKNPKKRMDPSDEWKKTCYDRNNARNRDIVTRQKAQNMMNYLEELPVIEREYFDEDTMIQRIDLNNRIKQKSKKRQGSSK
jgi:hypothetical protein